MSDDCEGQQENEVVFKKKRNIIPFRCGSTEKIVWPLQTVMVKLEFDKTYDGLVIKRWKCSTKEYLMLKLQGKIKELE